MNNEAFRSLVSSASPRPSANGRVPPSTSSGQAAFGSRNRTSIQLTPRNLNGHRSDRDYAPLSIENKYASTSEPPLKKFKSSNAPKGTKLGAGYVDRASLRQTHGAQDEDTKESDTDDKATRLQNLEEQFKLGQIDAAHFEKLKEQMGIGGDLNSTHLVKGLDWKLLKRVKRGESIDKTAENAALDGQTLGAADAGIDEELEKVLEKQVVTRESPDHTEAIEPTEEQTQQVLSRDEILRRFRERRGAPVIQAAPVLNDKFKKIAPSHKSDRKKFVESINGRRREVLIITNKDGTTKRKTRWLDSEDVTKPEHQPLGMEVPVEMAAKQKAILEAEALEDDNEDIFKDAGDDYDPLAGIESEEDRSDTESSSKGGLEKARSQEEQSHQLKQRNYFSTSKESSEDNLQRQDAYTTDPTMLAALKRAARIRQHEAEPDAESGNEKQGAKSAAFLARLKEQERQDAADLDYGFGEHRLGDEDDDAGPLYDEEEGDARKKSGRKRGPKKRKGDKNNVQDVMSALDGRSQRKPQG